MRQKYNKYPPDVKALTYIIHTRLVGFRVWIATNLAFRFSLLSPLIILTFFHFHLLLPLSDVFLAMTFGLQLSSVGSWMLLWVVQPRLVASVYESLFGSSLSERNSLSRVRTYLHIYLVKCTMVACAAVVGIVSATEDHEIVSSSEKQNNQW